MVITTINDNSLIKNLTSIDVVFDNLCSVNYVDYETDIIKDRLSDNCIAFIVSNQPDIHTVMNKYLSMGFKFDTILIYSKKISMVKSYKKSKIFIYVFTRGKSAKCVNTNTYGSTLLPVMSQREIYNDLIANNIKPGQTVVDFNVLSDFKADICSKNSINYVGIFNDEKLFKKLH